MPGEDMRPAEEAQSPGADRSRSHKSPILAFDPMKIEVVSTTRSSSASSASGGLSEPESPRVCTPKEYGQLLTSSPKTKRASKTDGSGVRRPSRHSAQRPSRPPNMELPWESLSDVNFFANGTSCAIYTATLPHADSSPPKPPSQSRSLEEEGEEKGGGEEREESSSSAKFDSFDSPSATEPHGGRGVAGAAGGPNFVVIKMLTVACATQDTPILEIKREIEFLTLLQHPGIVRMFGAGSEPRRFLVLERLEGGTLGDITRNLGTGARPRHRGVMAMPYRALLTHALVLAEALEYMHHGADASRMIIHRDLKPDNIGFAHDGRLKLLDFGLSRAVPRKPGLGAAELLRETYVMTGETGTLRYMAPEVARSLPYNETVDTYSYALNLWEMAIGKRPFMGFSAEAYSAQVVGGGVRPALPPAWPSELTDVITGCWKADARERLGFVDVIARLHSMLAELGDAEDIAVPPKTACCVLS